MGSDRLLTVVLAAYLLVVAWGTLGPAPDEEIDRVATGAKAAGRVVTGENVPADERGAASPSSPRFGDLSGEEVGNVAMFVPFGVLVPLRFRRWRWWTVPAGVALSGLIELTQLVVLSHRSAEWRDMGWNSLGALVGFALWGLGATAGVVAGRAGERPAP